jgi:hypothetical protein
MRRARSGHALPDGTWGKPEGSLPSFVHCRKMLCSVVSWWIHKHSGGCPRLAGKAWQSSEIPRLIHLRSQGP